MYVPQNTNLAYDLSLFDTEVTMKKREKAPVQSVKPVPHAAARNGNMFLVLAVAMAAVALLSFYLYGKAQVSEITNRISAAEEELELVKEKNAALHSELDSMVTLSKVEDYATNVLGMQKIQRSQVEHIAVNTESTTEIAESSNDFIGSISKWFSGILEYLGF